MLGTILVTIIGGAIIGLLGKLVAPGDRDNIPFWLTVVCGIIGMIVGSFVYFYLFGENNTWTDGGKTVEAEWDNTTDGIDWLRHLWQIGVAALAVMAAAFLTGRSKRTV